MIWNKALLVASFFFLQKIAIMRNANANLMLYLIILFVFFSSGKFK
jgi:hypothetical protein